MLGSSALDMSQLVAPDLLRLRVRLYVRPSGSPHCGSDGGWPDVGCHRDWCGLPEAGQRKRSRKHGLLSELGSVWALQGHVQRIGVGQMAKTCVAEFMYTPSSKKSKRPCSRTNR